jgi:AraC-like DNA-binding protein
MVCNRCIKVVRDEFAKLNLNIEAIELGEVRLSSNPDEAQRRQIREMLKENGFELIDDKKSQLIESIKTLIIEKIHHTTDLQEYVISSDYIAKNIGYDYSYLSHLFSSVEGVTIEKYIIHQKIEKAKKLLVYNELTLSEIAYQLGYSSVQHLSNQFKKITGLAPSHFKKLKENKRKPLDKV